MQIFVMSDTFFEKLAINFGPKDTYYNLILLRFDKIQYKIEVSQSDWLEAKVV